MWLGPLSTPIAPALAPRRSTNAPSSIAGQTAQLAPPIASAIDRARAASALPACGSATFQPWSTRRRPSSTQLASGHSLSSRVRAVDEDDRALALRRRRGASAQAERRRRVAARAERGSDQLARAVERVAVLLDADRVRRRASAPAVRGCCRRSGSPVPSSARAQARAISADFVRPCRSRTAS